MEDKKFISLRESDVQISEFLESLGVEELCIGEKTFVIDEVKSGEKTEFVIKKITSLDDAIVGLLPAV